LLKIRREIADEAVKNSLTLDSTIASENDVNAMKATSQCARAYHTLAQWYQSVLRTTTQVNGKVGNSAPAPSETPEPIAT